MQRAIVFAACIAYACNNANAQVGINTDSPAPSVGLHIKADFETIRLDGSSPFISFYNGTDYRGYLYMTGDNMYLYNRKNGNIFLGANNSLKMVITGGGDIGVGTSIPEVKLHVADGIINNGNFNGNSIAGFEKSSGNGYLSILTNSASESGILLGDEISGQKAGMIYNNGSTPDGLQFRTNGNFTRMSIDNVGDVGIGKTNPVRPLDIKSRNGGDEYGLRIERSGSGTNWELSVFQGNFNFFYNGASSPTAVIATNGNYSGSDKRLKKNIRPYKNVLPLVDQLKIDSYEYIADEQEHKQVIGLIAQEVENTFPEIVRKAPNRDGELYYAIDYTKTGVLALKAIQELRIKLKEKEIYHHDLTARLDKLQRENETLLRRLEVLESRIKQVE